jgi:hypothetical protein
MLQYCQTNQGRVQFLVVAHLSRFSRNTADHHSVRALLSASEIVLRSVSERIEESAYGRFVETILAGVNQLENDVKAERTVSRMREALRRGRYVWHAPLDTATRGTRRGRASYTPPIPPPSSGKRSTRSRRAATRCVMCCEPLCDLRSPLGSRFHSVTAERNRRKRSRTGEGAAPGDMDGAAPQGSPVMLPSPRSSKASMLLAIEGGRSRSPDEEACYTRLT